MKALVAFFVAMLLVPSLALADNVAISVSNENVILQSGDTQSVNVTVVNNEATADSFSISVFPPFLQGVTTSVTQSIVTIPQQSQTTATIYFSAPFDVQQFVSIFSITAKSFSNPSIQASKNILLQTVRRSPVYVSDIKLNSYSIDPSQNLAIDTKLTNLDTRDYSNYTLTVLVMKGGNILQRFDSPVAVVGAKSAVDVVNNYAVGKYAAPGDYAVQSSLKDSLGALLSSSSVQFRVNAIYKLPAQYTSKSTSIGFVSATTRIVVMNDGNVVSPSFYVTESLPSIVDKLFSSNPAPSYTNSSFGYTIYNWFIPSLTPGDSVIIVYQISLVPIWITLFILAIAVYFAYLYTFKPAVVKSHRHYGLISKEKEIPVLVEVKNRSVHEIKDIVVIDRVPEAAQLVEKFDTLKPRVKKTAGVTELVWRFDSLRPREERVLTYRIRPLMEAGELHLPHATVGYTNMKKQKKVIVSRKIVVK